MNFGLYMPNFGSFGDARVLANLARDAENAGWDGFFIWDHIAGWDLPMVDPWVALSAIAMNTERIKIGTTVTPLPRRRPIKLAREAVSVDHLSRGRLILGVGSGSGKAEYDRLGEQSNHKLRAAMLDEGLTLLDKLWSGETVNHNGRFYTVTETRLSPTPYQTPRIPIWVGGFWPNEGPFRRAAHWDGVFPLFSDDVSPDVLRELISFIQMRRTSDASFDVVVLGSWIGTTPENLEAYATAGATWWLEVLAPYRYDQDLDGEWKLDVFEQIVNAGPPRL